MIKKLLFSILIAMPLQAGKPTLQETLNALDYIRAENKEISAKAKDLVNQTERVIESLDPFEMIDIIIQTLKTTLERLKHFEENFYDYVQVAHILKEAEVLLEALPLDLTLTLPTPVLPEDEKLSFIDYGDAL